MPDLFHMLLDYDIAFLKIIATKWGIELLEDDIVKIVRELTNHMTDPATFSEVNEAIPDRQKECLAVLTSRAGKMPLSTFTRRFGIIREMGIARRAREKPFDNPVSVAEGLWFLGMIGKAFLKKEDGVLQEYVYIPDELLSIIPKEHQVIDDFQQLNASQDEFRFIYEADDQILDRITSFLAAIRSGVNTQLLKNEFRYPSEKECRSLSVSYGLMTSAGVLCPDKVKSFLAKPRGLALLDLFTNWLGSTEFNELRLMPGILIEGVWNNDPLQTRKLIWEYLTSLPAKEWWSIKSFISMIKNIQPDFQRPAGDFESWSIRSQKTGDSLHGYEHWDEIDGALIRYLITGPLHWLGFLDLGGSRKGSAPEAFRFSGMADHLLSNKSPIGLSEEDGHLIALRSGRIACPRNVPRAVRYQLARFSDWLGMDDKGYVYRISFGSLEHAIQQGLSIKQLTTLLIRHTEATLPNSLLTALKRWGKDEFRMSVKRLVILQVAKPEILAELRNSPIGRFLGEALGLTTVTLPVDAVPKIIMRLLEMGYFCELKEDELLVQRNPE